jgi:hypothetical protein
MMMLNPKDMDYKTVKLLMEFASKFDTDWGKELYCDAMGIYADRKYYIYESVKEYEEGDNIERIIEAVMCKGRSRMAIDNCILCQAPGTL